jgi:hypothetical protein
LGGLGRCFPYLSEGDRTEQMRRDQNSNVVRTTVQAIMRDRGFRAGFADARAGAPFAPDAWAGQPGVDAWAYERGWFFARLYPTVRQLMKDGHLSRNAIQMLGGAFDRGDIL